MANGYLGVFALFDYGFGACQLDLNLGADWKQEREVQKATHAFRERKATREAVQGMAKRGVLCGIDVSTLGPAEIAAFCVDAWAAYNRERDLGEYVRKYRIGQTGFISEEIEASRKPTLERMDATVLNLAVRLRDVGRASHASPA